MRSSRCVASGPTLASPDRGCAARLAAGEGTGLATRLAVMAQPVTVNDVLDGHVALDLECLDRIYLNAYVPNLRWAGRW